MAGSSLVLLSACTLAGGRPSPSQPSPISHPTDPDQLILRVAHLGGFVPVEWVFTALPAFSLMGDGTVIVEGAQVAIFPGPALPPLQARRLTADGIRAVLSEVSASGLFGHDAEYRGAQNFVADAADTVFTLNVEERTTAVRIYGLGTLPLDGDVPNLDPAEVEAHRVLSRLLDRLTTLETWLPGGAWADPGWRSYEPAALRLLIVDAAGREPVEGVEPQLQEWPLGVDLGMLGEPSELGEFRCAVLDGGDAATLLVALRHANSETRWVQGEGRYVLSVRPFLPDEPLSCEPPQL